MRSIDAKQLGMIVGEVVRSRRLSLGLSQEELASLAGIDRTFVSRIERGVRQPTISTLLCIGRALQAPATELMQEIESKYHF